MLGMREKTKVFLKEAEKARKLAKSLECPSVAKDAAISSRQGNAGSGPLLGLNVSSEVVDASQHGWYLEEEDDHDVYSMEFD